MYLTIGCFGLAMVRAEGACLRILCVNRNLGAMVFSFLVGLDTVFDCVSGKKDSIQGVTEALQAFGCRGVVENIYAYG